MRLPLLFLAPIIVGVALVAWLVVARPWSGAPSTPAAGTVPAAAAGTSGAETSRRIKATLFFITEDGTRLEGVEREVPLGDDSVSQARYLLEAALEPPPPPLTRVLPEEATLRGVYVSERGEAFVDLSPEASTRHSGGSMEELLSVYAIVNALTVNLPAITAVQILVGGREVDTLAGHIDLRNPLRQNLSWVRTPSEAEPPANGSAGRGDGAASAPGGTPPPS